MNSIIKVLANVIYDSFQFFFNSNNLYIWTVIVKQRLRRELINYSPKCSFPKIENTLFIFDNFLNKIQNPHITTDWECYLNSFKFTFFHTFIFGTSIINFFNFIFFKIIVYYTTYKDKNIWPIKPMKRNNTYN